MYETGLSGTLGPGPAHREVHIAGPHQGRGPDRRSESHAVFKLRSEAASFAFDHNRTEINGRHAVGWNLGTGLRLVGELRFAEQIKMCDRYNSFPFSLWTRGGLARAACSVILACGLSGAAHALIINQGEYGAGTVVVEGETRQPNQKITLDDRFTAWSDNLRRFTFRVRYVPSDCMVQLEAGRDVRPVYLVNCAQVDRSAQTTHGEAAEQPVRRNTMLAADAPSGPVHLRIVRQPRERNNECR